MKFGNPFNRKTKIDAKYWREIWWSKKKAREALVNLITPQGKVKFIILENGNQIPVEEATEEQAHEFMKELCPDWAFKEVSKK